jgi:lysophospholipase L1-like esterase
MRTLRALAACAAVLLAGVTSASPKRAWVAIGDSITYGYSHDATPYPVRLAALLDAPVVNMGIGSDTAANINTRLTNYGIPYPYRGVLIEECINDLISSTSGATCWTATEAAVDAAVAAGFLVVLMTAIPCGNYVGWDGTKETQRDAYNALVRAKAAADPTHVLLLDLDTVVSDNGNTIRAADDYGDGLHLDASGMQNLAAAAAALIQ